MRFQCVACAFALVAALAVGGREPGSATIHPVVARAAPTLTMDVLVKLPLRNAGELEALTHVQSDPQSPEYRRFLSISQFRARYAPLPATMQTAALALRASGLTVTDTRSQVLRVAAPVAAIERTFAVRIDLTRDARGSLRMAADAAPTLPGALAAMHATVIGLSEERIPRAQVQRAAVAQNRTSAHGEYWFDDLKQAYHYPSYHPFDGRGRTIAVVGFSDFSNRDALLYFGHERLGGPKALAPAPVLRHLQLGGTAFDPNSHDSEEADVDVQQAGGSAPGASIVGVAAPAMGEGFLYAYSVIDDDDDDDIVATSYNQCELLYTAAYFGGISGIDILQAYHELFLQGNSQGITFIFSSGDDAGLICPQLEYFTEPDSGKVFKDIASTSIWSDDPNVTSVGGTNLVTSHSPDSRASYYAGESAYSDALMEPIDPYGEGNLIGNARFGSGGGASIFFAKPWYQDFVDTGSRMREDPDISMQMGGCPLEFNAFGQIIPVACARNDSASTAYVGGTLVDEIGTSLAAPEFAGLLAVLEQAQGNVRLGNVNGYVYRLAGAGPFSGRGMVFHQGIPGDDGVVRITPGQRGYNPIVGVGTPVATNFLLLPFAPLAGDPQTFGNP